MLTENEMVEWLHQLNGPEFEKALGDSSWDSLGRILKWFVIPFSSGLHFVRTFHDLSVLGGLHSVGHSFIELGKEVVHVINLISFLGLWFSFCLPSER